MRQRLRVPLLVFEGRLSARHAIGFQYNQPISVAEGGDEFRKKFKSELKNPLDRFGSKMGISSLEVEMVKDVGAELIVGTELNYNSFKATVNGTPIKLPGLAFFDQAGAATIYKDGFGAVLGLANEIKVELEDSDTSPASPFNRDSFFGGFVPHRLTLVEREGLVDVDGFFKLMDEYRLAKPKEFAQSVGATEDQVKRIETWRGFVETRMQRQTEMAKGIWPGEDPRRAYADLYLSKEGWVLMTRSMRNNYSRSYAGVK